MPSKSRKMKDVERPKQPETYDPPTLSRAPKQPEAPASKPLLPTRWWEHAGQAMEPQRRDPILVVSQQVAQVLNMGIDRAVDVGERAKADKERAEDQAAQYRREYEWLREFLRNVRDRIGPVDYTSPGFQLELAQAIDQLELTLFISRARAQR